MQQPDSLHASIQSAIDVFDFDEARQLLKKALENPTAETYFLASLVSLDDEQKIEFLEKAVEVDPFHQNAVKSLNQALFKTDIDNSNRANMVDNHEAMQTDLVSELDEDAGTVLSVIFAPLIEYWEIAKKFSGQNIERNEIISITTANLTSTILGSTIIVAILGQLLRGIFDLEPSDFFQISDIPLLNELFQVFIFLLIAFVNTIFFHYPIKFFGGKGTFRHSFIANVLAMAISLPIIVPASWIAALLGFPDGSVAYASMPIMTNMMMKIHDISRWRFSLALIIPLLGIFFLFLFFINLYIN